MSLQAMSLEKLVQCEQKGWDRGKWVGNTWYIHLKDENSMACVGLAVNNPLSRVIAQMVLENSHLTS